MSPGVETPKGPNLATRAVPLYPLCQVRRSLPCADKYRVDRVVVSFAKRLWQRLQPWLLSRYLLTPCYVITVQLDRSDQLAD